jgi:hypothetical protein
VYRTWVHPPLLFAAEIGSISNTREAMQEKRAAEERAQREALEREVAELRARLASEAEGAP